MFIHIVQNEAEVMQAYRIEELSYSPEAAASSSSFMQRYRLFRDYFIVAKSGGKILGVANGVRLGHDDLSDEGMKQMTDYTLDGRFFCLLTVAVDPEARRQGIAKKLLHAIIQQAQKDRLEAIVLMCERHLIPFYESAGFVYVRPSASLHGGIAWHEMRLPLLS